MQIERERKKKEKNWNASKLDMPRHETIQYANVKHKIAILRESDDFGRNES